MGQSSMSKSLCRVGLVNGYNRAVRHRAKRSVVVPVASRDVDGIVEALGDHRLADLFIESQFAAMPEAWCLRVFARTYPPANTVFGGKAWQRYTDYIAKGERTPAW